MRSASVLSPHSCLHLSDQDPENPDVANGNADQPAADGEDVTVAATRKTKRKRWGQQTAGLMGALVADSDHPAFTSQRKVKAVDHHGNEPEDQDEEMTSDAQAPPHQVPPLFSAPHSRGSVGRNRE